MRGEREGCLNGRAVHDGKRKTGGAERLEIHNIKDRTTILGNVTGSPRIIERRGLISKFHKPLWVAGCLLLVFLVAGLLGVRGGHHEAELLLGSAFSWTCSGLFGTRMEDAKASLYHTGEEGISHHEHSTSDSSFVHLSTPLSNEKQMEESALDPFVFALKHIYHHNTERKPLIHKRLDITETWLKEASELWWSSMAVEEISESEKSDDTLNNSTYFNYQLSARPRTFAFSKEYPIKMAPFSKKIRRIADQSPDTMEAYLEFTRTPQAKETNFIMDFDWIDHEVPVPDVQDRDTIITLAYMASDAYVDIPHTGDWTNVSDPWNNDSSLGLGWQEDGVRGHVFTNVDSSIVVISIKGTSAAIFDSGGDTAPNDKINDNLLFSCCCARISYLWNTVCDCYTGDSYTCNQECLEEQLYSEDRYYRAVLDIYRNVTSLYPDSTIWVTGHSLGGSLAALLGRTYGLPTVGFEAPPEQLATKRLHLPQPPGIPPWEDHIWHFGHTADPVFMGVCNGAGSTCWIAGYAMETQCHTGLQCVYDVVEDLGWHVSMVNHRIHVVIDDVILAYNTTPTCRVGPPCEDCFNWNFVYPSIPEPPTTTNSPISSTTTSEVITSPGTPTDTGTPEKCIRRSWYGRCIEYGPDDPPVDIEPDPGSDHFT
ncbi:triglyceride lipase ATG15 [Sugiyamaella lignohabitans]|uniref:Putative lipase ATG15 n=1 Tax=Sugiyamaella lignohabitans TaxID=796027 RepID=A0A167FES2_9ASCO|nr:triglyceride lipase ATG15 [Sugiyamaella lignohabitans]ANB15208.1 triglyceride lipase ATG15 [Sugiyamaella lignohabitans]